MKPIKTTTTVALLAIAPVAAQAMPVALPMSVPAPAVTRDAVPVQPVFLDLQQLERDLAVLLNGHGGNGGDSGDRSRDGNSDDDNDDDDDRNGGGSNGGNSGGGNGGDS